MITEIFSGLLDPFCHCGILSPLGSAPAVLESESPSSLSRWGKGSLFYGSNFSWGPNGYGSGEQTLPTGTEPFLPGCKRAAGARAGKAEGAEHQASWSPGELTLLCWRPCPSSCSSVLSTSFPHHLARLIHGDPRPPHKAKEEKTLTM